MVVPVVSRPAVVVGVPPVGAHCPPGRRLARGRAFGFPRGVVGAVGRRVCNPVGKPGCGQPARPLGAPSVGRAQELSTGLDMRLSISLGGGGC